MERREAEEEDEDYSLERAAARFMWCGPSRRSGRGLFDRSEPLTVLSRCTAAQARRRRKRKGGRSRSGGGFI